jgi:TrmH family RNA methyltransferase
MTIVSPQNPRIKAWRALNKRRSREEQGAFIAEGEHMVQEALRENAALELLCDADQTARYAALLASGPPVTLLSPRAFAAICDAKTPQGIAAVCALPASTPLPLLGPRVIALNGLQDPGNAGTILRTMDAAGFTGLIADENTADLYAPKALRASMGAVFRVPMHSCGSLAEALSHLDGYDIVAADLQGTPFFSRPRLRGHVCLVIGSEGAGIAPGVLNKATYRLKLPMPGKAESLNAAVAAGIMMYDLLRLEGYGTT